MRPRFSTLRRKPTGSEWIRVDSGHSYDLVVVGSGIAGLFAALAAAPDARVLVVSKGPPRLDPATVRNSMPRTRCARGAAFLGAAQSRL